MVIYFARDRNNTFIILKDRPGDVDPDISFTFAPLTVHLSVMDRSRTRIRIANSGIITLEMAYVIM